MAVMLDKQELKPGLVIYRRDDVKHRNWYCRLKVPNEDLYKTISLGISDINQAKNLAYDHDAELRFKIKHQVPIFNKLFSQVAAEFAEFQSERAAAGEITQKRADTVKSYINTQLNRYVGHLQITQVGEDFWKRYPIWRQKHGKGRGKDAYDNDIRVSEGTIRSEMTVFQSVMLYAASKSYIRENQTFRTKMKLGKPRRDAFTAAEYKDLHTFARGWIAKAQNKTSQWYRLMTYNFMLVMTNTGMRPPEARNLRWRDIEFRKDKERHFVWLNVRGKGKFRELIAAQNVAKYLDIIKKISKATEPNDFVFTTIDGKAAVELYKSLIADLFDKSGLLFSSSGKRRSTYSFRHTYATFRLMSGVDVYFLAEQMGTSVQMIEDYYGHVKAAENAERILKGVPGWEPLAVGVGGKSDSVNAGSAKAPPQPKAKAKPRTKK